MLVGKIDEVWKEACQLEAKRKKIQIRKRERKIKNGVAWESPITASRQVTVKKPSLTRGKRNTGDPPVLNSERINPDENPQIDAKQVETKKQWEMETNEEEEMSEEEEGTVNFFDLKIRRRPKNLRKAWLGAKKLVNLGELSKAMSQFKTIGVAPMTPLIKKEVSSKFEKADIAPSWPTVKRVRELRESGRAGIYDEDLKDVVPHENESIPTQDEWWKYYREITSKEIVKAANKARRTTAAGLNGITPWQYKRAIEHSPSNSLANTLAQVANRIGKSHFDQKIGASCTAGRLIPLIQKEGETKGVPKLKLRPIIIGDTARRLLVRAVDEKVREDANALCGSHQLNVTKGGYEVGIHATRAELKRCLQNGNYALKIDLKNAFNSIKRCFFLELIAVWLPHLLPSAWLHYSSPSKVYSNEGVEFSSEEGAQQGDHVGNHAFSMVAKYLNDRLQALDFALKLFYVDDLILIGSLETLNKALDIINQLENTTGIKLNFEKTVIYCPNENAYEQAKEVLGKLITVENSLNMEYLKCPIGDDDFVKRHLEKKLSELKQTTEILSEMPYLHEAWTLLKYCGSSARVNHLQRVIPPNQIKWFNEEYDKLIRSAYTRLLGVKHIPDWSWNIQKLPPRLGGVLLRTGCGLSATKYSASLASVTHTMKNFLKDWNSLEVFERDAWKELEDELGARIEPKIFFDSLIEKSIDKKLEIGGIQNLYLTNDALLRVAETRVQNKLFSRMTERQKVWTTANSGDTQGWTQTLPLTRLNNVLTNFEFRVIFKRRARLPVFTGAMKCASCKNLTADQYGDHTLRCENRIQRHNFVSTRLKKILQICGYKVTVEEGCTLHDRRRPGDLLVWNWKPGFNLYIDVSVIDPTSHEWRNHLV